METSTQGERSRSRSGNVDIAAGGSLEIRVPAKKGDRLRVTFAVAGARSADFFSVTHAAAGDTVSLIGPLRRLRSMDTELDPLEADAELIVTWDNSGSWLSRTLSYQLDFVKDGDVKSESGPSIPEPPATPSTDTWQQVTVGAGTMEEIPLRVSAGASISLALDVVSGGSIGLGIMLRPADASEDDPPLRLYGPISRTKTLRASVPVDGTGTAYIGFDNTRSHLRRARAVRASEARLAPPDLVLVRVRSAWYASVSVRYHVECLVDETC